MYTHPFRTAVSIDEFPRFSFRYIYFSCSFLFAHFFSVPFTFHFNHILVITHYMHRKRVNMFKSCVHTHTHCKRQRQKIPVLYVKLFTHFNLHRSIIRLILQQDSRRRLLSVSLSNRKDLLEIFSRKDSPSIYGTRFRCEMIGIEDNDNWGKDNFTQGSKCSHFLIWNHSFYCEKFTNYAEIRLFEMQILISDNNSWRCHAPT